MNEVVSNPEVGAQGKIIGPFDPTCQPRGSESRRFRIRWIKVEGEQD